jgi:signal transduction histidine kinase
MDADVARRLLLSGDHRQRLEAARALLGHGRASDRHLIATAARREDDQYVRSALLRLLVSLPLDQGTTAATETVGQPLAGTPEGLRSVIVRQLTDLLTHELATIVGTLSHYAKREVATYSNSETKREIDRLDSVLKAMRALGDAAAPPQWKEVDISTFLSGLVQDERLVHNYEAVLTEGPSQHNITADEGLVALFVRNAISNAVEATLELHDEPRPIVVAWGTDDRDHWIAVLDDGPGVSAAVEQLSEIGASTKDGHPGLGLTIAKQVSTSLGGDLALLPQARGGCVCRLNWPRRDTRV